MSGQVRNPGPVFSQQGQIKNDMQSPGTANNTIHYYQNKIYTIFGLHPNKTNNVVLHPSKTPINLCDQSLLFALIKLSYTMWENTKADLLPSFTYMNGFSCDLSLVVRKPVFGVSDQVQHKPGCTVTEDG